VLEGEKGGYGGGRFRVGCRSWVGKGGLIF